MSKIDKYWTFDVVKFIKDYNRTLHKLIDLREALKEITEIKAQNYDCPPGTPERKDSVAAVAERAEAIREEIAYITPAIELYEKAEKSLSEEEKIIIRYFFHEPGQRSSHVRFLMRKLSYSQTEVYRKRAEAVDHFLKLLQI